MPTEKITIGSRFQIRCTTCQTITNHELKFLHTAHYALDDDYDPVYSFEGPSYWEEAEYRVWVCLGCDTACFQQVFRLNGDTETETSAFYPKRTGDKRAAKEFRRLPKNLQTTYQEVIVGFNAGLRLTSAIGLRTLLEGICVSKGITDKEAWGFEGKLRKLDENNHLPSTIVEALHSFKFIGDEAAYKLNKRT